MRNDDASGTEMPTDAALSTQRLSQDMRMVITASPQPSDDQKTVVAASAGSFGRLLILKALLSHSSRNSVFSSTTLVWLSMTDSRVACTPTRWGFLLPISRIGLSCLSSRRALKKFGPSGTSSPKI